MSQARGREKVTRMDVKGAKAMFENSARRQREPSPAPTGFGGHSSNKSNISSFKEKFEQFTAPRQDNSLPIRKAVSVENVTTKEEGNSPRQPRSSSSGRAERNWLSAKTKIYEKLTSESKSDAKSASDKALASTSSSKNLPAVAAKPEKKLPAVAAKPQITSATKDKIKNSKSDEKNSTKKEEKSTALSDNSEVKNKAEDRPSQSKKASVKDIKSNFTTSSKSSDQQKPSQPVSSLKNKASLFEKLTTEKKDQLSPTKTAASNTISLANKFKTAAEPVKKLETKESEKITAEPITKKVIDSRAKSVDKKEAGTLDHKVATPSPEQKENNNNHKTNRVAEIKDHISAKTFMEDLISAIDNEQHVPMKQLINLFEKMKEDNSTMRDSLEQLRKQLDRADIEDLNKTLQGKLDETAEKLVKTQTEMKELELYKQALEESDERCEELEELNRQYFQEIEYLKLEMNEMRDQFHDDEVHETIILQQRLDDMARSLRIIHFRLKKADARLQETEREKESLLEEIRLLQGGTFTDEEIKRMQALEGDLQSAKEVSIQLHTQLEKSEERQEKLEKEAARLRDELKAANMENDRLRNNIQHLREQMSNESMACSTDSNSLCPTTATLVRQGSSTDMETLKSNLESAIERENDLKEQLKYAEEEARMLRKRLRDIENENEALTKQLKKLSQIAHAKSKSPSADSVTSESIQTEVIQLENAELRSNNDKLHHKIESLQDQVKSLQQKLELMEHEQNDGPLCHSKNSLYYETKFELMSKEIDDLRWQLHEKELDRRRLRDDSDSQSKFADICGSIDDERYDPTKQLEGVRKEAETLKARLHKLEKDNRRLEDGIVPVSLDKAASRMSLEETNKILTSKVSVLEKTNADLLQQLQRQQESRQQESSQQLSPVSGLEKEWSRLQTQLNLLHEDNPDIASLVNSLQQSEEKLQAYENEIETLRRDRLKMERTLQDDINSLTMKNSILSSLLEAINHHEGTESIAAPSLRSSSSDSGSSLSRKMDSPTDSQPTGSGRAALAVMDMDTEAFISRHISRLPSDIQKQFRDRLVTLENQLQEERERAKAAENLLQQVKLHLKNCALSSPIIQILQPRKPFKYPSPPPSLIIKPSASNSPSHAHLGTKANKLTKPTITNAISTPERMKIGHSLASEMYLGNFPTLFQKTDSQDTAASDDEVLTVSIQPPTSEMKFETEAKKEQQNIPLPESPLAKRSPTSQNGYSVMSTSLDSADLKAMLSTDTTNGIAKTTTSDSRNDSNGDYREAGVHDKKLADEKKTPTLTVSESAPLLNGHYNGEPTLSFPSVKSANNKEKEKMKKSNLRNNFFENYSSLISRGFRAKKKVSFALPALERDVSDMSISSHLSAAGDCVVVDDDDEDGGN